MNRRQDLLSIYEMLPFEQHPLWQAIFKQELSYEQVISAEVQHCIRTRRGQTLRRNALEIAEKVSPQIFDFLLETYLEECTQDKSGPSHLELIERLVMIGGRTHQQVMAAVPTPANAAAIALYADIGVRGAGCHMLGAGAVEYYYSHVSPKIYSSYVESYGMSEMQAETYRIHGPMDREHAERAFSVLDEAIDLHGWDAIQAAVRDAFVATSLHYDGMLHAATGELSYWDGRTR